MEPRFKTRSGLEKGNAKTHTVSRQHKVNILDHAVMARSVLLA